MYELGGYENYNMLNSMINGSTMYLMSSNAIEQIITTKI